MAQAEVNVTPDGTIVVTVLLDSDDLATAGVASGFAETAAGQSTASNPPTEGGASATEAGSAEGATHIRSGADYSPLAEQAPDVLERAAAGEQPAEVEGETTGQVIAPPAETDRGAQGAQGADGPPAEVEGETTGQELAPPADTDRGAA